MEQKKKLYVGNGNKKTFDNGGEVLNISVCMEDLKEHMGQFVTTGKNGKHYIRLDVVQKRQTDDHGFDYYVAINTFQPRNQGAPQQDNSTHRNQQYGDGEKRQNPPPRNNQYDDDGQIPF